MAGSKEETKAEPFSDPRVAVGEELDLMTTFEEMRKGLKNKKRLRFLKGLKRRKRTGSSGKEFWTWIEGYEGLYQKSNKGRVRILVPTKKLIQRPQQILSGEEAKKFLKQLGVKHEKTPEL
jgi:hypothetical protein